MRVTRRPHERILTYIKVYRISLQMARRNARKKQEDGKIRDFAGKTVNFKAPGLFSFGKMPYNKRIKTAGDSSHRKDGVTQWAKTG